MFALWITNNVLPYYILSYGIVRVINIADADAVVFRNIERLHPVALCEASYAPFLYTSILQIL